MLKNFTYEGAGRGIDALAFRSRRQAYSYLYINTENLDRKALSDRVLETLKSLSPAQTFTTSWLDEELEKNNSQVPPSPC